MTPYYADEFILQAILIIMLIIIILLTVTIIISSIITSYIKQGKKMNIKKSIRLAMTYKGISKQSSLANISGVNTMTISNAMMGRDMTLSTIKKISDSLGYSVSEFIKLGEGNENETELESS